MLFDDRLLTMTCTNSVFRRLQTLCSYRPPAPVPAKPNMDILTIRIPSGNHPEAPGYYTFCYVFCMFWCFVRNLCHNCCIACISITQLDDGRRCDQGGCGPEDVSILTRGAWEAGSTELGSTTCPRLKCIR
jgi:hypothetical protein